MKVIQLRFPKTMSRLHIELYFNALYGKNSKLMFQYEDITDFVYRCDCEIEEENFIKYWHTLYRAENTINWAMAKLRNAGATDEIIREKLTIKY